MASYLSAHSYARLGIAFLFAHFDLQGPEFEMLVSLLGCIAFCNKPESSCSRVISSLARRSRTVSPFFSITRLHLSFLYIYQPPKTCLASKASSLCSSQHNSLLHRSAPRLQDVSQDVARTQYNTIAHSTVYDARGILMRRKRVRRISK